MSLDVVNTGVACDLFISENITYIAIPYLVVVKVTVVSNPNNGLYFCSRYIIIPIVKKT